MDWRASLRPVESQLSQRLLKFCEGFLSRNHEKLHGFNFCEYIACLILRPVTDDLFLRLRLTHEICENFNIYDIITEPQSVFTQWRT